MQLERDALHQTIFPALNDRRSLQEDSFLPIDLRWGISTAHLSEEEAEQKAFSVCFDEIDTSRPYFLAFLGERYGYQLRSSLLEKILPILKNPLAKTSEEKRKLLASSKSITELEIRYGSLFFEEKSHLLFFFRDPLTELGLSEQEKQRYEEASPDGKKKLAELKREIQALFPEQCIAYHYERGREGELRIAPEEIARITTLISSHFIASSSPGENDAYAALFFANERWRKETAALFGGREKEMEAVRAFLSDKEARILAISGPSGSGKSALAASASIRYGSLQPWVYIPVAFERRLSDERAVVQALLAGIASAYHTTSFWLDEEPDSLPRLLYFLVQTLAAVGKNGQGVLFVLDGLDRLSSSLYLQSLAFLTPLLLEGIPFKLIVTSATPFEEAAFVLNLAKAKRLVLGDLSPVEAEGIVKKNLLTLYGKELSSEALSLVVHHRSAGFSLYLRSLLERLLMLNRFDFAAIEALGAGKSEREDYICQVIRTFPDAVDEAIVATKETALGLLHSTSAAALDYLAFAEGGLSLLELAQLVGPAFDPADFLIVKRYLSSFFLDDSEGHILYAHPLYRAALFQAVKNSEEVYQRLLAFYRNDPVRKEGVEAFALSLERGDYAGLLHSIPSRYNDGQLAYLASAIGTELKAEGACPLFDALLQAKRLRLLCLLFDRLFATLTLGAYPLSLKRYLFALRHQLVLSSEEVELYSAIVALYASEDKGVADESDFLFLKARLEKEKSAASSLEVKAFLLLLEKRGKEDIRKENAILAELEEPFQSGMEESSFVNLALVHHLYLLEEKSLSAPWFVTIRHSEFFGELERSIAAEMSPLRLWALLHYGRSFLRSAHDTLEADVSDYYQTLYIQGLLYLPFFSTAALLGDYADLLFDWLFAVKAVSGLPSTLLEKGVSFAPLFAHLFPFVPAIYRAHYGAYEDRRSLARYLESLLEISLADILVLNQKPSVGLLKEMPGLFSHVRLKANERIHDERLYQEIQLLLSQESAEKKNEGWRAFFLQMKADASPDYDTLHFIASSEVTPRDIALANTSFLAGVKAGYRYSLSTLSDYTFLLPEIEVKAKRLTPALIDEERAIIHALIESFAIKGDISDLLKGYRQVMNLYPLCQDEEEFYAFFGEEIALLKSYDIGQYALAELQGDETAIALAERIEQELPSFEADWSRLPPYVLGFRWLVFLGNMAEDPTEKKAIYTLAFSPLRRALAFLQHSPLFLAEALRFFQAYLALDGAEVASLSFEDRLLYLHLLSEQILVGNAEKAASFECLMKELRTLVEETAYHDEAFDDCAPLFQKAALYLRLPSNLGPRSIDDAYFVFYHLSLILYLHHEKEAAVVAARNLYFFKRKGERFAPLHVESALSESSEAALYYFYVHAALFELGPALSEDFLKEAQAYLLAHHDASSRYAHLLWKLPLEMYGS